MVSAQRNGGASVIAFRGIDVTPTTTSRSMLLLLLLPRTKKHSTDGDTTISMYTIRWTSCHIQYTYNSWFDGCHVIFNTHTILLTKSNSCLSNLKSNNYKIEWHKKKNDKDDDNDNSGNSNNNNNNNNKNNREIHTATTAAEAITAAQ